ncbi:MAG: NAD(P)H-dependent oxidoreductase [Clostridia bacterium]|nr:NAD(P)H-dependent oxidoreductase [Clostridia bacterium]
MVRKLVAYFSATGVTAKVAELIADAAGADVYQIQPEVPYTTADLNWMDKTSRSSVEMNDKKIRPAMVKRNLQVEDYDIVFLGFPIWWYVAPTIINTFLESFDFAGKKIILFATSGGSGFGKTVEELKVSVTSDTQIVEGKLLNGKQTLAGVSEWISSLKL